MQDKLPEAAQSPSNADTLAANLAPALPRSGPLPGTARPKKPHALPTEVQAQQAASYSLQDVHGQGGLGRVWIALDRDLNRQVALKELLPSRGSAEDIRGFLREAQITGQLEHPNIVPVYSLGRSAATGEPFYTMRLVRGQTLSQANKEFHQREGGQGPDRVEQRRLLSAFISVCNALAFAHSRGVIHRDLKPANVLLGEFGEVVVLDWGLAKLISSVHPAEEQGEQPAPDAPAQDLSTLDAANSATVSSTAAIQLDAEASEQTRAGSIKGTLGYMAPEQTLGRPEALGAATDIYGLGAMLFELLAGQAPHQGKDVLELLHGIVHEPTPRARAVKPSAPAALEAVCFRAMAKQPEDRYASASELAREVERWLADEAVSVYRDPWLTRMSRWARRHKALVTASAVLLIAAVAGLSLGAALLRQEQLRTAQAHSQSEENFQRARQAVDQMLTEVADEQLADAPYLAAVRRTVLEKALAFYRDFSRQKPGDWSVQLETARAWQRVGEIQRLLDDYPQSQHAYRQSITLLEAIQGQQPDRLEPRHQFALSCNELGESHRLAGETEQAIVAYRQAQATQQELVAQRSQEHLYHQELARTLNNLSLALRTAGQREEAESVCRAAIIALERIVQATPQEQSFRRYLAQAQINLGTLLKESGRAEQAEKSGSRAIELLTGLVAEQPESREYRHELASAYVNRGNLLLTDARRRDDVRQAFEESIRLFDELASQFAGMSVYRKELANGANSLGGFFMAAGDLDEAQRHWSRAEEEFARLAREFPQIPEHQSLLGMAQGNLASVALRRRDFPTAADLLEQAIKRQTAALSASPNNPGFRQLLRNHYWILAETRLQSGSHRQAALAAAELPKVMPDGWEELYRAARMTARCVPLAKEDAMLSESERDQAAQSYASEALSFLERAIERGFADAKRLEDDTAWTSLREDERFQQLRKSLPPNS